MTGPPDKETVELWVCPLGGVGHGVAAEPHICDGDHHPPVDAVKALFVRVSGGSGEPFCEIDADELARAKDDPGIRAFGEAADEALEASRLGGSGEAPAGLGHVDDFVAGFISAPSSGTLVPLTSEEAEALLASRDWPSYGLLSIVRDKLRAALRGQGEGG